MLKVLPFSKEKNAWPILDEKRGRVVAYSPSEKLAKEYIKNNKK